MLHLDPDNEPWGDASVYDGLAGLWSKLIPMIMLFFCMAFNNALLDTTGDTLIVTAFGGSEVIPFLTVYGVLPSSFLFLLAFMRLSDRLPRRKVFYLALLPFVFFLITFMGYLYPNRAALHPNAQVQAMLAHLPRGLAGALGMVEHWTFTLFYICAELWGDVVCALLFWQLANETTTVEEAAVLYPLFGIGANLAQAVAGRFLRNLRWLLQFVPHVGMWAADAWTRELNSILAVVLFNAGLIAMIHAFIMSRVRRGLVRGGSSASLQAFSNDSARTKDKDKDSSRGIGGSATPGSTPERPTRRGAARGDAPSASDDESSMDGESMGEAVPLLKPRGSARMARAVAAREEGGGGHVTDGREMVVVTGAAPMTSSSSSSSLTTLRGVAVADLDDASKNSASTPRGGDANGTGGGEGGVADGSSGTGPAARRAKKKEHPSLRESLDFLSSNQQIRYLAVMALAQGLSSLIFQTAWKGQLRELHPIPSDYSAFMGDTQTVCGLTTLCMMLLSSSLFKRLGWEGSASVTPRSLAVFGTAFLVMSVSRYLLMPGNHLLLSFTVKTGVIVFCMEKAFKFSLFKPAEEMVYIGLDAESQSKGKAAIDVLGAQMGKSVGSLLQQGLIMLLGSLAAAMPAFVIVYISIVAAWLSAIRKLAHHHFGHSNNVVAVETDDLACNLSDKNKAECL
eukprot:jgi/Mesvir1/14766/Mv05407-RA.1